MTAVSKSIYFFALSVLLVVISFTLDAQELRKLPRIGILEPATAAAVSARVEAFRQGLRALGYMEGQNIAIEYRYANGNPESLPDLSAELVNLNVDLIATSQTPSVLAIKKMSSTIPIVFFFLSFPIENGIAASFARPGGNATGLTVLSEEPTENAWNYSRTHFQLLHVSECCRILLTQHSLWNGKASKPQQRRLASNSRL